MLTGRDRTSGHTYQHQDLNIALKRYLLCAQLLKASEKYKKKNFLEVVVVVAVVVVLIFLRFTSFGQRKVFFNWTLG